MRKFKRAAPPQYLTDNWEKWGLAYAKKKQANSTYTFQWKQYTKKKVNQLLLPFLTAQTDAHCSYCDHFPMGISDDTIDHFSPKGDSRFYHLVYNWLNLYYCCADCQRAKMESYDFGLLRPDDEVFSFERYFIVKFATGEIESNPSANEDEQMRASTTISILQLNDNARCTSRKHAIQRFQAVNETDRDLNDFPYRFLFE
jgi:uncharacterized protein (TIGR02646 family)